MRSAMITTTALVGALASACTTGRVAPLATLSTDSVSVGYGRVPAAFSTASTAVLDQRQLDRTPVAQVEQLFEGRVAGVQVVRTAGGDFSLRIRGAHSFMGDAEPLFILDGVPLLPGTPLGSALVGIVPADIARIEVLKDAGSTAIYGLRGGNGVVIITTKRGR